MNSHSLPSHASELVAMLEELNSRIARLSHVLGADIRSDAGFEQILERKIAPLQTHGGVGAGGLSGPGQRRTHQEWEELRGLLILRCEMMTQFIDDFGIETTRELAEVAESALASHGFAPGADGLRLFCRLPLQNT